jgi:hypothetical protein
MRLNIATASSHRHQERVASVDTASLNAGVGGTAERRA